jgi:hypothetical protein
MGESPPCACPAIVGVMDIAVGSSVRSVGGGSRCVCVFVTGASGVGADVAEASHPLGISIMNTSTRNLVITSTLDRIEVSPNMSQ